MISKDSQCTEQLWNQEYFSIRLKKIDHPFKKMEKHKKIKKVQKSIIPQNFSVNKWCWNTTPVNCLCE